ncbi:MAG TPA: hypothetical protein VI875_02660 [Candidatus Norongarragalinales archaeon]|nr:hypothetical protein [Candidatus Norongarragalinales archaeon]
MAYSPRHFTSYVNSHRDSISSLIDLIGNKKLDSSARRSLNRLRTIHDFLGFALDSGAHKPDAFLALEKLTAKSAGTVAGRRLVLVQVLLNEAHDHQVALLSALA